MSHDFDVRHRLVARLRGAAASYRAAGADGPGLADVVAAPADAHDAVAQQITAEVRALGGAPAEGSASSPSWAELSRAIAQGETAFAEAKERAEAELLAEFQAVLDDPAVSGPVRAAVLRAFDGVKAGHDRALQRLDALGG